MTAPRLTIVESDGPFLYPVDRKERKFWHQMDYPHREKIMTEICMQTNWLYAVFGSAFLIFVGFVVWGMLR